MIIGIDEVGYGCWAGPLYLCALRFKKDPQFSLFDSKQLSIKKRESLFEKISEISQFQLGVATVEEINTLGLAEAYKLALFRAVKGFEGDFVIDGRKPKYFDCKAVIHGDSLVQEISAASIIAKVSRDRYMLEVHSKFPEYGFAQHKGYGTKMHQVRLKQFGFCPLHRIRYNLNKYL